MEPTSSSSQKRIFNFLDPDQQLTASAKRFRTAEDPRKPSTDEQHRENSSKIGPPGLSLPHQGQRIESLDVQMLDVDLATDDARQLAPVDTVSVVKDYVPACLRLPDDVINLIIQQLTTPSPDEHYQYHNSFEAKAARAFCPTWSHHTHGQGSAYVSAFSCASAGFTCGLLPVRDLKQLALVHSRFLEPVRAMLYNRPNLEGALGDRGDPCLCSSCQVGRSPHWDKSPLPLLAGSLARNPHLGTHIRHLDKLGELTLSLACYNISPSLISRTVVSVISKAPNVISFDMPTVELRDHEDVICAMTRMRGLRKLRLGPGCAASKDSTSLFNESHLRRIALSCQELEELEVVMTDNIDLGSEAGYIDPYGFRELRDVRILYTSALTDKHLMALLVRADRLRSLTFIRCAGLDGSALEATATAIDSDSGESDQASERSQSMDRSWRDRSTSSRRYPRPRNLTTAGIAAVLSIRGSSLRSLTIDVSDIPPPTESTSGTIPSIENALVKCPNLQRLSLQGPGLILPTSLPKLGASATSSPSGSRVSRGKAIRLPPHLSSSRSNSGSSGLASLETLTIGLTPPAYNPLLNFLLSLPPSSSSPYASLRHITITNPPRNCTGQDPDAILRVQQLQQAVGDKSVSLTFASPNWECDNGQTWARPQSAFATPLFGQALAAGLGLAPGTTATQNITTNPAPSRTVVSRQRLAAVVAVPALARALGAAPNVAPRAPNLATAPTLVQAQVPAPVSATAPPPASSGTQPNNPTPAVIGLSMLGNTVFTGAMPTAVTAQQARAARRGNMRNVARTTNYSNFTPASATMSWVMPSPAHLATHHLSPVAGFPVRSTSNSTTVSSNSSSADLSLAGAGDVDTDVPPPVAHTFIPADNCPLEVKEVDRGSYIEHADVDSDDAVDDSNDMDGVESEVESDDGANSDNDAYLSEFIYESDEE
ncbi:hypothetical protein T439DRAFT_328287 [Meredithblackwellia eburnea MCA 4105]